MSDDFRSNDTNAVEMDDRWRHLIGHIQDAVVEFELVDGTPIVRNVNNAFVDVFGFDADEVVNAPLNDFIVPEWRAEEAQALDTRTSSGEVNYRRVRRITAEGLREFLYRGIPYDGNDSRLDGFAVYTDLTDLNRRERQLQVLNRVLRHNLRNKANVIAGNTAQLLDQFTEQSAERTRTAATVEKAAHDLVKLAEEASSIRQIIADSDTDVTAVDCVPMIRRIVSDHRETAPRALIETDLPVSMVVQGSGGLSIAIDGLVENAIEHNPTNEPRVHVDVARARTEGWVDVRIEDDAPRIPLVDRSVIVGRTEITQTRHGLGLGLWLAKWATELSGGELFFETSDIGGNSVRLRLKASERSN